jgi:CheY-like chemotaxis protein
MNAKRVLSVGQCFADHGAISSTLHQHFGAEVVSAATAAEAFADLRQKRFDLVLVNRVLDADASSGLDLIRQLKEDETFRAVAVMLVSNYADAQRQAVEQGALPGFGKASLGQPEMVSAVKGVLG